MKKSLIAAVLLGLATHMCAANADSTTVPGESGFGPGPGRGGPCKAVEGDAKKACRMEHRGEFFDKNPDAKAEFDAFREKQHAEREAFHKQMREKYGSNG